MAVTSAVTTIPAPRSRRQWYALLPVGIFVLGMACSLGASLQLDHVLRVRERDRFEAQAVRIRDRVAERIDIYIAMMQATASLVASEPDIGRSRFDEYIGGLRLQSRYPGITFVGYSRHIDVGQEAELVALMRSQGEPNFHLWPEKPADQAARDGIDAIIYTSPYTAATRPAIGFDMRSERIRREAMDRALDTGRAAASAEIELLSPTEAKPLGFIIYQSVSTRSGLAGYVFSSFRTSNFFQSVVARELGRDVGISAYDGPPSPQTLLFENGGALSGETPTLETSLPLPIGGRTWTLHLSASEHYRDRMGAELVPLFLGGGILTTVLLTIASLFQARAAVAADRSRAEIATLNANLETRVAERTRDLEKTQELLREHNETLETVIEARTADLRARNEEIREFVHVVSHDLRAPLVNILGFVGELERLEQEQADARKLSPGGAPDPQHAIDSAEATRFIRTSADKLQRLIGAILKLSRDGRRQLLAEPLDMTRLIRGIAAGLQFQCEERGATITVGNLPNFTSDAMAVEQIFANLLENAVKYLAAGRPGRISVTGETRRRHVVYEVSDNGRGIAAADQGRVFELFRRAATDQPGEGLGLASVRMLVRQLGADIVLSSSPGEGSVFRLTFPRRWTPPEES